MTVWTHTRKGRIVGVVEAEDPTWVHIRLTGDQRLKMLSADDDGWRADGHRLTVRRSFLKEVAAVTEFRHNGDGSVTVLRDGYPPSHTAYFAPDQWQAVEEHVLRGAIRRVREDVARRTPLEVPEVEDEADDG